MTGTFSTSIQMSCGPAPIWRALTNAELMSGWLGEPQMEIQVLTSWQIDSPIIIRGFHNGYFENKGTVLVFEKEQKLAYTHLSSVSGLADTQEHYSVIELILTRQIEGTLLTVNIERFPTEIIRKHLEFYWKSTLAIIKAKVEERPI